MHSMMEHNGQALGQTWGGTLALLALPCEGHQESLILFHHQWIWEMSGTSLAPLF